MRNKYGKTGTYLNQIEFKYNIRILHSITSKGKRYGDFASV